jgi:hypothetical protein
VQGGVDGSLHLTVPSMNRLNQTEPATFSILSFWAFFRDFCLLYFFENIILCKVNEDGRKRRNTHMYVTSIEQLYCFIPGYIKTCYKEKACDIDNIYYENMIYSSEFRNKTISKYYPLWEFQLK